MTEPPKPPGLEDEVQFLRERLAELADKVDDDQVSLANQQRTLTIKELEQRIEQRQIALIPGVCVMVLMAVLAAHGMHKVLFEPRLLGVKIGAYLTVPSAYAIALIIAPIVSITTIGIALLIGTFRGFKDKDTNDLPSLIVEAGKMGGNL